MINNVKDNILINEKLSHSNPVISFLFGMLGAIFFIIILHAFSINQKNQKIAIVDVTHIVDQFIKAESKKNLSAESLKTEVTHFGKKLEMILAKTASEENIILLPKEAVIAGRVKDVTSILLDRIETTKNSL